MLAGHVKANPSDRSFWGWVKAHYDPHDFSRVKTWQRPRDDFNRCLNAHPRDKGPTIRLRDVVEHRRVSPGQPFALPLYGKPRYSPGNRTVVMRIDVDAHHAGQRMEECGAFVQWLSWRFSGLASLYTEPTERGHAAWIVVDVLPYEWRNHELHHPSARRLNTWIGQAADALKRLALANGFAVDVELQGKVNVVQRDRDSRLSVVDGGRAQHGRLPRCSEDADVARLLLARTNIYTLTEIVNAAAGLPAVRPDQSVKAVVLAAGKAAYTLGRRMRDFARAIDPTSKHSCRVQCVRIALREVMQSERRTVLPAELVSTVIDRANTIYEAKGYNSGRRDKARDGAFVAILKHLLTHTDPTAKGAGGGVWFGEGDLAAARRMVESWVTADDLAAINENPNLRRCKLTHGHLALAFCTVVKNAVTSNGAVPTSSVMMMLRHFGLSSNGTQVDVMMMLLAGHGVIRLERDKYGPGICRKWSVGPAGWSLPFVRHLVAQPSPVVDLVVPAVTARPAARAHSTPHDRQGFRATYLSSPDTVFGSNAERERPPYRRQPRYSAQIPSADFVFASH